MKNDHSLHPWYLNRLVLTGFAVLLGFLLGGLALALSGYDPFAGYGAILAGIFAKPSSWMNVIVYSTPLIFTGLSVGFAFKTGLFNIGAEGQFIVGALGAALAGVFFPLPPFILPIAALLTGIVFGAAWGGLAGWIKARFGVHEVITTIMLNWIALYLNNFVVMLDGIRRTESQSTKFIQDSARIDILGLWKVTDSAMVWRQQNPFFDEILRSPVNWGILIALATTFLMAWLLKKTTLGFELKAVGHNPDAAKANGISIGRSVVVSMAIAGALAAAAGAVHVLGNTRQASLLAVMEGNGFDGIAVALIGNSTPWGAFFSALFYGALKQGGPNLQFELGAPSEVISIVMGSIIFFLAVPGLLTLAFQFWRKKK